MINAYVITLHSNEISNRAADRLINSMPSNLKGHVFDAVEPEQVDDLMKKKKLKWTYPWATAEMHFASGLLLNPYPTQNPKKRIACFLSHYSLWEKCVEDDEPIIIHEHDALYFSTKNLPIHEFEKSWYNIIGMNSPLKATRMAQAYNTVVQESEGDIVKAPLIDDHNIPQGIAGNSSYYIKPAGAKKMISLAKEYGCWPNDALMCRQLVSELGQTKHYYTGVQGLESTTSR